MRPNSITARLYLHECHECEYLLEHSLNGKWLTEVKEVENHLTQYFASQTAGFYRREIKLLPVKWPNFIDYNSEYRGS
jgi:hypothetical protein